MGGRGSLQTPHEGKRDKVRVQMLMQPADFEYAEESHWKPEVNPDTSVFSGVFPFSERGTRSELHVRCRLVAICVVGVVS